MSWTEHKLGELIEIKHGYAFKSQYFSDSGKYILLTPGNCYETGGLKLKGDKEKYFIGDIPKEFMLKRDDLLIVMTDLVQVAPILGGAFIIPEANRFLHNQRLGLVTIRNSNELNKLFLYYLLNTEYYRAQVRGSASGATVRHTAPERIYNCNVKIPTLYKQQKIAAILGAYDDLIENNTRRIQILKEMAQALYREWFVKFRFPGHEGVKMVESELGLVPEGWEVITLDDVCQLITDGSHLSPKSVLDGLPMASVKDMHDYGFSIDKCRKIGEADYQKLVHNNCKPLKDDILIAKDGSYLKHIFVVEKDLDMVILSSIAILRPNGRMRPHLLAMYLRDPSVNARMKGYVSGVAVPRIVLKDFRKFAVLVPPEPLQYAWGELAAPMVEHCWCMISKNTTLRRTRDLLLPQLISGEVDVSNLEIETEAFTT